MIKKLLWISLLIIFTLLSGCGGGGGGGVTLNTPTTISGGNTQLFSEVPNAFPDLTYAYKFFNINSQNFASVVQSFRLDIKGSNQAIFGMAMQKGTDNWQGKVTDPCQSKIFLFKINNLGNFQDVTDQMIEGTTDLGGCIRKAKRFDINGDGITDIIFAVNEEDGRSAAMGSTFIAQMAALVSLPNGRYSIVKFGDLNWYHSIGAGVGNDGIGFVTGAGFYGTSKTGYSFSGNTSATKTNTLPPISPNTFEFISTGANTSTDYLIQTGIYPNIFSIDGYKVQSDGTWKLLNTIQSPFPIIAYENFVDYTSDTSLNPVADMSGTKVLLGGGYSITESCKIRIFPGDPESVIMKMELPTIPKYISGKIIRNEELVVGNKLIRVQIADDQIKSSPLTIVDEVIFDGLNGYINFECFDFNRDGYQDIVVFRLGKGKGGDQIEYTDSSPFIYLNQKDGTFKRIATELIPAMLPIHYTDLLTTIIGDFNGDGMNDVILFPSNPGGSVLGSNINGDVKFFKGNK
jgi:hypothetical protein